MGSEHPPATLHGAWRRQKEGQGRRKPPVWLHLNPCESSFCPCTEGANTRACSGRRGRRNHRNTELTQSNPPAHSRLSWAFPIQLLVVTNTFFTRDLQVRQGMNKLGSLQLVLLPAQPPRRAGICSGADTHFSLSKVSCVLVKLL